MDATFLRPGESKALLVKHLLRPSALGGSNNDQNPFPYFGVVVAPQEDEKASKTGTFDDTVLLDSTPWIGHNMQLLCHGKAEDDLIFGSSSDRQDRSDWNEAVASLGLPKGTSQQQLRHGGASSDSSRTNARSERFKCEAGGFQNL